MVPAGWAWIDSGVEPSNGLVMVYIRDPFLLVKKEINYLSTKIQAIGSGRIEEEQDRRDRPHFCLSNTFRVFNSGQSHTWRTMHTDQ